PESRSASRLASAASTAKARWMASSPQNSTATQNRPGVALSRVPEAGSRANANRMSTSRANGAIWLSPIRARASIRRSWPATSSASRNTGRHLRDVRDRLDHAAGDGDHPPGEGVAALELVGGDEHGRAGRRRVADELVDEVAGARVETG